MSVRKGISLLFALSALTFLAACGGGGSRVIVVPPPSGAFSASSLSGTYVFSASGTDYSVSPPAFFAATGTIVANGSGSLTGGSFDFVDPALAPSVSTGNTVSGGTYLVGSDGRGTATLPGNLVVDFVLTSKSHGLIIRFDGGGTGSGTLDLQTGTTVPAGSYAFSLAGVDSSLINPLNSVGAFTVDGTGTITTGVQDFNDHYTISSETGLTNLPLTGSVVAGANGATLTTTSVFGSLTFDVFPIDSTHLRFVEIDGVNFLTGDAFTQQTTMPTAGQMVFTMAGFDVSGFFMAAGGYLTSDGSSLITAGLEDINDDGGLGQSTSVSGNFAATGGGRFTLTLNGIFNGTSSAGSYTFAAYPSSIGIQLLEIDGLGITSGAAYAQSATSLSTPQGYALNLTGVDTSTGAEVDEIAEFTAQNGTLTGIADINDGGSPPIPRQSLGSGSTYALDTPATGRGVISTAQFNLFFYVVDSSNVIFIETDTNPVALGTFQLQNGAASDEAAVAARPIVTLFRPASTRAALRHK
jgi:hypothetical protein